MVMLVKMLRDVIYDNAIQVSLNAKKEHREEGGEKQFGSPLNFFFLWIGGSIPYSIPISLVGFDLSY
jgi:hypothetical protein